MLIPREYTENQFFNLKKPLQEEKSSIEAVISDMKVKGDQAERRNAEMRESEEKKHAEEIAFLKKTNSQLKVRTNGPILF